VHHQVEPALRRRGDPGLVAGFLKAVNRVQHLVALAAVACDDEHALGHAGILSIVCLETRVLQLETLNAECAEYKRAQDGR
jgi:hypothetical protein